MSLLHTVTITGADELVDPRDLARLGRCFPFVEWGILWNCRDTKPRYPSIDWMLSCDWLPRMSLHLCGRPAREAMGGDFKPAAFAADVLGVQRVQINGFSNVELEKIDLLPFIRSLGAIDRPGSALSRPAVECILQCTGPDAMYRARLMAERHDNISALIDASGGRGYYLQTPVLRPPEGLRVGWAGGINITNLIPTLELLEAQGRPYWIDLETGARDADDRFDLDLVERILTSAEAFICGAKNG